ERQPAAQLALGAEADLELPIATADAEEAVGAVVAAPLVADSSRAAPAGAEAAARREPHAVQVEGKLFDFAARRLAAGVEIAHQHGPALILQAAHQGGAIDLAARVAHVLACEAEVEELRVGAHLRTVVDVTLPLPEQALGRAERLAVEVKLLQLDAHRVTVPPVRACQAAGYFDGPQVVIVLARVASLAQLRADRPLGLAVDRCRVVELAAQLMKGAFLGTTGVRGDEREAVAQDPFVEAAAEVDVVVMADRGLDRRAPASLRPVRA